MLTLRRPFNTPLTTTQPKIVKNYFDKSFRYLYHSVIDTLIYALGAIITILALSGGIQFEWQSAKIELSQIDVFGITLFLIACVQRYRKGRWLPDGLTNKIESAITIAARRPVTTVTLTSCAYVTIHTAVLWRRWLSFKASAFDMGYVDHAIWSTAHGSRFLHSTISRGETYLGEHFAPILAVLSPLYRLTDSPLIIFFAQSVLLASGAIFLYWIARARRTQQSTAILIAILFLCYQPLRLANQFDLREDVFFVPIFFAMILFFEIRKWALFWISVLAALLIKENAPIFLGLFGLGIATGLLRPGHVHEHNRIARRKNRAHGLALITVSLIAFGVINLVVTPHFAGASGQTMATKRLAALGANNHEILLNLVLHPWHSAAVILKPAMNFLTLKYALQVLFPFVTTIGYAPWAFVMGAFGVLLNIVVNMPRLGFHYELILLPFLFYGLAIANSRRAMLNGLLILMFLPFFGRSPIEAIRRFQPTSADLNRTKVMASLPREWSLSTQTALHPHALRRSTARLFSSAELANEDLIVLDTSESLDRYATPDLWREIPKLEARSDYEKIYEENGLRVWKKRSLSKL